MLVASLSSFPRSAWERLSDALRPIWYYNKKNRTKLKAKFPVSIHDT